MAWYDVLNISGLWNSGTPVPVDDTNRLPTTSKIADSAGAIVDPATETTVASRASEATLALVKAKTDNLDLAMTALRDALRGASSKDLSTVQARLDLLLSEATGALIKAKTDNLDITLTAHANLVKNGKTLADIWNTLQLQRELSESIWTDNTGAYFVRRVVIDESAGTFTVTWTDVNGNASAGPGTGSKPLSSPDRDVVQSLFTATAGGTGYSSGDILARCLIIDNSVTPPSIVATLWFNITLGTSIGTPTPGSFRQDQALTDAELRASPISVAGLPTALKSDRLQVDGHVLARYKFHNSDDANLPSYFGFLAVDGSWYIMKQDSAGVTRYANLSNNPTINGGPAVSYGNGTTTNEPWTNRATLNYALITTLTGL